MLTADLEQALLAAASDPAACRRIAAWQRSLGQAAQAARWQRWSLISPTSEQLELALSEAWLDLGQLDRAAQSLGETPSWIRLELLLKQGDLPASQSLQQELLTAQVPVTEERFLAIAASWQSLGESDQALELLLTLAQQLFQAEGRHPPVRLCNAIGGLQESAGRFEAAAPWWAASLLQVPEQPAVLMRMARWEERSNRWPETLHYVRQVLAQDPHHSWALELQVRSLIAQGAPQSAQLALAQLRHSHPERALDPQLLGQFEQLNALPAASHDGEVTPLSPEQLEGHHQILLVGSASGAALSGGLPSTSPGVVWALDSPEPLVLSEHLNAAIGPQWQLLLRPQFEADQLAAVSLVVIEHPCAGGTMAELLRWLEQPPERSTLHWQQEKRQWCDGP